MRRIKEKVFLRLIFSSQLSLNAKHSCNAFRRIEKPPLKFFFSGDLGCPFLFGSFFFWTGKRKMNDLAFDFEIGSETLNWPTTGRSKLLTHTDCVGLGSLKRQRLKGRILALRGGWVIRPYRFVFNTVDTNLTVLTPRVNISKQYDKEKNFSDTSWKNIARRIFKASENHAVPRGKRNPCAAAQNQWNRTWAALYLGGYCAAA